MVGHSASLPSIYYELLLVVLGFWALFQFCLRRSSKQGNLGDSKEKFISRMGTVRL